MLAKLKACGMDLSKVALVEEPESERHIFLRDHPKMDRRGLECVAEIMTRSDYGLRTASWASEQEYHAAFDAATGRHLQEAAKDWLERNRPDLVHASYRAGQSLQSYANQIETTCGAPKGYIDVFRKSGVTYVATNGQNASPADVEKVTVETQDCMNSVLTNGLPPKVAQFLGGGGVP